MRKTFIALTLSLAAPLAGAQGSATFAALSEAKWSNVPDAPGVQIAPAQGDPAKGPSHFYLKFAPGFSAPEHHHSANHHVAVIAGKLTFVVDGEERKVGPGAYFSFRGKKPHSTRCEEGECILLVDARGKWDVLPGVPRAAKKG